MTRGGAGGGGVVAIIFKKSSSLLASDERTFAVSVFQGVAIAGLLLVALVRGPAASKLHYISQIEKSY